MTDPSAPLIPFDVCFPLFGMGMEKEKEEDKRKRNSPQWGQTPLDLALRKGHDEIIQMLVEKGGKCLQVCEGKGRKIKTHERAGTSFIGALHGK